MKKYIYNYHTHTYRCGHATGSDEDYVRAAIQAGYQILGFSDHAPYHDWSCPTIHMNWDQLDDYLSSIKTLQKKYAGQIKIRLGLETEYYPQNHEERAYLLSRCEYLLFGQHLDRPDNTPQQVSYFSWNTPQEILEYGQAVCRGLESGLFLYLAHPDVFMTKQKDFDETCVQVAHMIAAKALKTNTPLEINFNGVKKGTFKFPQGTYCYYPHRPFWEIVSQYPVDCVVGVDAHSPSDLLNEDILEEGLRQLKDLDLHIIDTPLI